MSGALLGAGLGLLASGGVLIAVFASPPMRPIRLVDRVAPYLGETSVPSRLLSAGRDVPFATVRRIAGPALADLVARLDRILGSARSVRRRLDGLGSSRSVEDVRIEQVLCAAAGMLGGAVLVGIAGVMRGAVDPVLIGAGAILGVVVGVFGRDRALSRQLERREHAMLAEFPVVADLLALAVLAGESPAEALARVCRVTRGELARDLDFALGATRTGSTLAAALTDRAERTSLEPYERFLRGIVVAVERGTPLARVLRAQALDVREVGKRELLDAAGRKEIAMMLPVVFLILPVTVLFALYPGLLTLTSIAR